MNMKAVSKKLGFLKGKSVYILLFTILTVVVVIISANIISALKFNASLPDPDAATEMNIYRMSNNTVLFRNGDISVVALGYNAKYSDYLALAGNHVDVLFLSETNESVYDNLSDVYVYGGIDKIYVPKGASKDFMKRMKEHFNKSEVIKLRGKGEKFVLSEFVIRVFDVTDGGIAFSLTHGHDNFLVANDWAHGLKSLKNTSFKAVFAPYGAARVLTNVEYLILQSEGGDVPVDELHNICMEYVIPGNKLLYGLHKEDTLMFDASFTPTGKLK